MAPCESSAPTVATSSVKAKKVAPLKDGAELIRMLRLREGPSRAATFIEG